MESFTWNCTYSHPLLRGCKALSIIFLLLFAASCDDSAPNSTANGTPPGNRPDALDEILESGKLHALTDNSATGYFIYRGIPMGYEYELLELFAGYLDVDLDITVIDNTTSILDSLEKGFGRVGAANFTVTQSRKERFLFSEPHLSTRQVLLQKLPEGYRRMTRDQIDNRLIKEPKELAGKTVHVREGTSFHERTLNIQAEIGDSINIVLLPDNLDCDSLMALIDSDSIRYSIEDENIANFFQTFHPQIDIRTPVSFSQNIAWILPKNSERLRDTINAWIRGEKGSSDYAYIYNKYFKWTSKAGQKVSGVYNLKGGGRISPFDDVFKKYAESIGWDWSLIASLVKQESNFDPSVRSWAGALGLMQLMPATALQYGIDSNQLIIPESNVYAGTKYIGKLHDYWLNEIQIPDSQEVIKFTLASYNVGIGHIQDARRLAVKHDLDPNVWIDNVEKMILLKSNPEYYRDEVVRHGYCRGREPYNYVRNIFKNYEHYRNFLE